jgi:hypothetical protein
VETRLSRMTGLSSTMKVLTGTMAVELAPVAGRLWRERFGAVFIPAEILVGHPMGWRAQRQAWKQPEQDRTRMG